MKSPESWQQRATWMQVGAEDVAVVDINAAAGSVPLLILHGFPTSSVDFCLVADRLADKRRVVALDYPGFGLSSKPDRAYSLFEQAGVVEAVVAELGIGEVDLLTHDMGDSIGGELLARSLDGDLGFAVRRRILTNGSIYLDDAQLTDGQKFLLALPDAALDTDVDPQILAETLLSLCAPANRDSAELRATMAEAAELVVRDGGSRLLPRLIRYIEQRALHERRWTGAIESHPAALTVVWGRHDPVAVSVMAERLLAARADAELIWFESGHWPMVEEPDRFAGAVLAALG